MQGGGGEGQEFIKRTAKDWEGERKVQGSWKRWATRNSECRGANEGRRNRKRKKGGRKFEKVRCRGSTDREKGAREIEWVRRAGGSRRGNFKERERRGRKG